MRMPRPAAVLALCLPLAALAQKSPDEVTARQIFQYQANIESGCKDSGRRRGDPADRVGAFCKCMIDRMRATVPADAWQKAFYYSERDPQKEREAMLPHLPNLQECRK